MTTKMFEEEPEPLDENDPEVWEETFETFKFMEITPSDLNNPIDRAEYAKWLEKQ